MRKISAGLVMYRINGDRLEVLLVHPGGPFWTRKDERAWFIPKGETTPNEDALAAAKREFQEETGMKPEGPFIDLGSVKHKSGKIVQAWGFEGDCDTRALSSNTFTMEWPPRSGQKQEFPEIDRAEFFSLKDARSKIYPAEFEILLRLQETYMQTGTISKSLE